jgi:IS30 family transposase
MKQLTIEQRYQMEAYLKLKMAKDFIAKELNVHRSTIFREFNRNRQKRGGYSAKKGQECCSDRKDRYVLHSSFTNNCKDSVIKQISQHWSPKQIVGYCKQNDIEMVSHERIYQFIRLDKKNGGKLYKHCRHQLKHRKRPVGKHFPIANRVSIDERPEEVSSKIRFGDWEMDTIIGAHQQGAILTLTERKTNFIIIKKLESGKNAKGVKKQVIDALLPYKNYVHTITTDNGPEFAEHLEISKAINAIVYFAHPYCSWEKGSIEHANKLIRQYVKKDSNLNEYPQIQLTEIQHKINSRPREKLNFDSPKEIFYNLVSGNVAFGS